MRSSPIIKIAFFFIAPFIFSCGPAIKKTQTDSLPTISLQANNIIEDETTTQDGRVISRPSIVEVTYRLSAPTELGAGFKWSTGNRTAQSGRDFQPVINNAVNISPGEREGVLRVAIISDNLNEDSEVFTVNISASSLSGIHRNDSQLSADITITDNDPEPVLTIGDAVSIDESGNRAEVRYTLSSPSGKDISFRWSTENDSAESSSDYTLVGNLKATIGAERTSGHLVIPIRSDSVYEQDEVFHVVIDQDSLEGAIAPEDSSELRSTVTIINDDFPTINLASASNRYDEGIGEIVIDYTLSVANTFHEISFRWLTESRTASPDLDYREQHNTITISPSSSATGSFRIPIIDDNLDENDETLEVLIDSDSLTGLDEGTLLSRVLTITDDDAPPNITIHDQTIGENIGTAEIIVSLSAASGNNISFSWSTEDVDTTAGSDYTAVSATTVTIPAGSLRYTLPVTITDDTDQETPEDFRVKIALASLEGVDTLNSDLQATITIIDRPFIRLGSIRVNENDQVARVPYFLSSASSQDITFTWDTSEGTAKETDDFTGVADQSVTIASGSTRGTLDITLADDNIYEGLETLTVTIDDLVGIESIENVTSATINIIDDEDVNCPDHYIKVPAFSGYVDRAFCVSKYEMKQTADDNAIAEAAGSPWVNISRNNAITKCTDIGSNYDLINNDQWQSIARSAESVRGNWSRQQIGSAGGLNRGHSDNSPAQVLAAHSNDNRGCYQTGQICDSTDDSWSTQKRTHTLVNGEVIWDIAGNAAEWIKDDSYLAYGDDSYISLISRDSHPLLNALSEGTGASRKAKDQFGSRGNYEFVASSSNFHGLGYGFLQIEAAELAEDDESINLDDYVGILRGGELSGHNKTGIFAVDLGNHITNTDEGINGFRCVYVPDP